MRRLLGRRRLVGGQGITIVLRLMEVSSNLWRVYRARSDIRTGGCCPVGYICTTRDSCIPPLGATITPMQCPTGYYLCPSTLNYGCCKTGMACAQFACYSTDPVTSTFLETITTTVDDRLVTTVITSFSISTPTAPTFFIEQPNVAAKFIPTAVAKVPAETPSNQSDSSDSNGGLSPGAIGGIIAGVVALLIVVVIAAFLVIRRLRHVEQTYESSSRTRTEDSASRGRRGAVLQSYASPPNPSPMQEYHRAPGVDDDMSLSADPTTGLYRDLRSSGAPLSGPGHSRGRSDSSITPSPSPYDWAGASELGADSPTNNPGYAYYLDSQQQAQASYRPHHRRMHSNSITTDNSSSRIPGTGYQYPTYPRHWRQQSNTSEFSSDGSDQGGVHAPLIMHGHRRHPSSFSQSQSQGQGYVYGPGGYQPVVVVDEADSTPFYELEGEGSWRVQQQVRANEGPAGIAPGKGVLLAVEGNAAAAGAQQGRENVEDVSGERRQQQQGRSDGEGA